MHEYDNDAARQRRGTFAGFFLTLVLAGGFLFFLVFVSGGFFLWVAFIAAGIFFFAGLHYVVWGWALSQGAAAEREEMETRERDGDDNGYLPPSEHIRRF